MTDKTLPPLRVERPHDEAIEFYVGDLLVGGANHDDDGWSGMDRMQLLAKAVHDACSAAIASSKPEAPQRDREADRRRFPDPVFNRWLDEGIADGGWTVWDAVGDVQAAWSGWDNRQHYEALAAQKPEGEAAAWQGEEWERLAWHICAEEHGEEACTELIWEGGLVPEPWGDRWMKYEGEAKRMIALVRQHATTPPAQPAAGWQPIETAPKDEVFSDGANRYARRILVWGRGLDEPLRARWWWRTDSDASNFIADGGRAVFPSHWQALPAAPETGK